MAAGIPPHILWDYTPRELYAVFAGRVLISRRQHQLAIYAAWHTASYERTRKLPNLAATLRKLEPARLMSPKTLRDAIVGIAQTMGATVRIVPKGSI